MHKKTPLMKYLLRTTYVYLDNIKKSHLSNRNLDFDNSPVLNGT